MGFDRKDDRAPERWFEPIYKDGNAQVFEDYYGNPMTRKKVERLLDDYYDERGYEVEKGLPSRSKLIELGLEDVAVGFD
jgi:aldehyde:ferredoxin oxidoreductase